MEAIITSCKTRELHTVSDIYAMAGTAAVFSANGHFDIDEDDSGHAYIEEGHENGTTPSAHFLKTDDDVYHATDFMSLSMASAMYHFENIKSFYDEFSATEGMVFPKARFCLMMAVTTHQDDENGMSRSIMPLTFLTLTLVWINPYNGY